MKLRHSILLAAPLVALLGGCVVSVGGENYDGKNWQRAERENRENVSNLRLGMTEDSVRDQLGKPDFSEAYKHGADEYHVLFYRTQRQREDGITTKDECTPVVMKNSALIGWGDKVYREIDNSL